MGGVGVFGGRLLNFLALLQTGSQVMGVVQGFALRWYSPRMLGGEGSLLLCGDKVVGKLGRSLLEPSQMRRCLWQVEGTPTPEELAVPQTYRVISDPCLQHTRPPAWNIPHRL